MKICPPSPYWVIAAAGLLLPLSYCHQHHLLETTPGGGGGASYQPVYVGMLSRIYTFKNKTVLSPLAAPGLPIWVLAAPVLKSYNFLKIIKTFHN